MFSKRKKPPRKVEKEESDESDSELLDLPNNHAELQELKAKYEEELKALGKREEELTRDNECKEDLIKRFSSSLKDKTAALAEWEKREVFQKQAQLETLKEEIAQLVKRKEELERQVQIHSVYKDIIEKLCSMSLFEDVDALTAHLENLNYIRAKYTNRLAEMEERMEQERKEQLMMKEKHTFLLLQENTEFLQLQNELTEARSEALKWERIWNHIKDTASKKTLELGKIKMATHNLYEMTKGTLGGVENVHRNDTEKQLDHIILFFEDHVDILKQYDAHLRLDADGENQYKAQQHNVQK
ncbi:coiled-coil domain-containing protein 42 homolog [Parambassis ranga]|uniref:Coiled-coil domain-containing protein 42 homolog n=1 Tax=Parambassis ranga TaxID=210632 RepID=A0A6P7K194_9TELE|nr:coiled-coil domain-containing protein 42 [Parambassis ranga]